MMAYYFRPGDAAYIIDNGRLLREVTVLRTSRDLCVIRYADTGTVIRIRNKRLYSDEKEAIKDLPPDARPKRNSHWDYYLNH